MEKQSIQVEISGELGARTIAEMVQIASKYESSMHIEFKELTVNAKSIMGMMSLHIENGDEQMHLRIWEIISGGKMHSHE